MAEKRSAPATTLLVLLLCLSSTLISVTHASPSYPSERKREMRQLIRETWQHGFDSYMNNAFPQDELLPLSCTGQGHDRHNPSDLARNDVCGDYALTLVDSLDSFAIFGDHQGFADAVRKVIDTVTFHDKDVNVQVFEATIRVLGGLLSAHNFAIDPRYNFQGHMPWYEGQLLDMARDLGHRMLPAFTHSATGMPYSRINLSTGLDKAQTHETCSAAAGSLMLEFATLSRLTGEPVFEQAARKAMHAVWNRRSSLGLLGNSINMQSGHWLFPQSSIGAGIDSIFEYMVKTYALLGDEDLWDMWADSYKAVNRHLRASDGLWYRGVNMLTGGAMSSTVDSLSAFWPGLQVLAGDIEGAIRSHQLYANIWRRYSGLPETYSIPKRAAESKPYPLRPELIESTLLLYSATGDDAYLRFAERAVRDIISRTRVGCGLAGIENVETGELEDRMHSFALGETLKYAYLIFDEANLVNQEDSNTVYTTEGHPLSLPVHLSFSEARNGSSPVDIRTCTVYDPIRNDRLWSPLMPSVDARIDADYGRMLAGVLLDEKSALASGLYSSSGFCERPPYEDDVIDLLFGVEGSQEDSDPSPRKLQQTSNGLLVHSIENLRFQLAPKQWDRAAAISPAGQFDIVKIGPHKINRGQSVTIADPTAWEAMTVGAEALSIRLTFLTKYGTIRVEAVNAAFGPVINGLPAGWRSQGRIYELSRVPGGPEEQLGCEPYSLQEYFDPLAVQDSDVYQHAANTTQHQPLVLVRRGKCTFFHKARMAAQAGAVGVIVMNTDESHFTPSAEEEEIASFKRQEIELVPLSMINNATGSLVEKLLASGNKVAVKTGRQPDETHSFVVNGYTIANAQVVKPADEIRDV